MSLFYSFIILFQLGIQPKLIIDTEEELEQNNLKAAVVNWADSTFLSHENYKFEDYRVFYTDEYFMQTMRVEMYEEKIAQLEEKKATNSISLTEDEYHSEIKKLEERILKAKEDANEHPVEKIAYYTINFWSNIQTSDGITVYYEIKLMVDSNLVIIEAKENSSIGKKSADTKILYKPTAIFKVSPKESQN